MLICFSVPAKKGFKCTLSVRACVYKYVYFCVCLGVYLCVRAAEWLGKCLRFNAWTRIPSVDFDPGNPRQVCPVLEYMVSGWRSVIAVKVSVGVTLNCTCTYKPQRTLNNVSVIFRT